LIPASRGAGDRPGRQVWTIISLMGLLMRPGSTLLLAGVLSFAVSRFIDFVPLIGGMLAVMTFLFAMFAVVGGTWLLVMERRAQA
jgi:hypothetical protein